MSELTEELDRRAQEMFETVFKKNMGLFYDLDFADKFKDILAESPDFKAVCSCGEETGCDWCLILLEWISAHLQQGHSVTLAPMD